MIKSSETPHKSVLLNEVISVLAPKDGGIYVDGTFGAGGYSKAILETANCQVIAIDRDPSVLSFAQNLKEKAGERFTFISGCFSNMKELLSSIGIDKVDGVVLDVGVSSMQIDDPSRGFSFQKDGVLDMRMEKQGLSASDIVNTFKEKELADIIYEYGEERHSRKIAKAICEKRKTAPFSRTLELAELIASIMPRGKETIHPATRTFQALRIYVNDELNELKKALSQATNLLKSKGCLAVVSFHSLEDRIVKNFMAEKALKNALVSRHLPLCETEKIKELEIITKKPILPSKEEITENPRSRSAKLRAARKLGESL